ncbi:MAG: TolC family protein [Bacteroidetes bacterium]|nr:TolC family protein [Bacteroidota bacterium]MBS1540490.1 TolC family protein [Bacteroidota bacterium]
MKTKIFLLILIGWAAHNSFAQSTVLEAYISEGLKNNLQLQQEQLNYERSLENLAQAKALFLPYAGINASYQLADGGRKISIPVGDMVNPVYQNLNAINAALHNGAPVYPQIANQTTNFLANNFHDTKVRIIQPLFNPEIYFNYKAQKEMMTVQQAQKKAYENQLRYEIASAYFQYLQSAEAAQILKNTHRTLQQVLKVNQTLVANAKATKDIVLNTEYQLMKTEQQFLENEKNTAVTKSYFNFLLNRELDAAIVKDTTLSLPPIDQDEISVLTQTALKQRQEVVQLQNGLHANEQLISLSKGNALLPKINVVGDVGYQGFYYTFGSDQQYWLVQFGLTWDLFKGGEKRTRVQQARIDYQVTENKMEQLKKQIELQVIQSHYELATAKQAYRVSQNGVRTTEKSFDIIRSKYNGGTALLIEFIDSQNNYTTAQLTHTINKYEWLRKAAALQKTISSL